MKRFIFVSGLAIGFVLGSMAGRGPYETLSANAQKVADDPVVREKTAAARESATKLAETVKEKAPEVAATVKEKAPEVAAEVKDKASATAATVSDKVRSASDDEAEKLAEKTEGTATAGGTGEVGEDKPLGS